MRRLMFGVLAVLLIGAGPAMAQTVVTNPTTLIFTPSPDHAAMTLDGVTPLVTNYQAQVYLEVTPTGTPLLMLELGKPTPNAQNQIEVTNAVWFAGMTPKTRYVMKVAAVGPTGTGVSLPSDPFGNAGPPGAGGKPTLVKR